MSENWLRKLQAGDKVLLRYGKTIEEIRKVVRVTERKIILSEACDGEEYYSKKTGKRWGWSPWGEGGIDEIRPCN